MIRRLIVASALAACLAGSSPAAFADEAEAPTSEVSDAGTEPAVSAPARPSDSESPASTETAATEEDGTVRAAALGSSVSPNTGLSDGSTVTVSWTGATPGTMMYIIQCSSEAGASACDMAGAKMNIPNPDGAGSTTFDVQEGTVGDGTCSATSNNCVLLVNEGFSRDADKNVKLPIKFGAADTTTPTTTTTTTAPPTTPDSSDTADTTSAVSGTSATSGTESARSGANLANTGAATGWQLAAGLSSIGAGWGLLRAGRRNRRTTR